MNKFGRAKVLLIASLTTTAVLGYQACSRSSFQSHESAANQSSFSGSKGPFDNGNLGGGTTTDNPKPTVDVVITGYDTPGISDPKLCIKEITFAHSNENSQVPFDPYLYVPSWVRQMAMLQYLSLTPQGTYVDSLTLPSGNYDEVDLSLDPACAAGSLSVQNSNGLLQLREPIVLRFNGSLNLQSNIDKLNLNIQPILAQLADARTSTDIKRIIARTYGSF